MGGLQVSKLLRFNGAHSRRGAFLAVTGLVVAVLGGGVAAVSLQQGETRQPILLEAADSLGPQPFLDLLKGPVPSLTPAVELVTAREEDPAPGGVTVVALRGDRVGLYGGTTDDAICDRDQLVEFLQANPAHAGAWAGTQGLDPAELGDYIGALTPVVLRLDTRVTNHGFDDGRASPRHSVLQAGTSVLVDDHGVPRARCACGNPLLPPTGATAGAFSGEPWDGFDGANVVHVTEGARMDHLVLVRLEDGELVERPVGTGGADDLPLAQVLGIEVEQDDTTTTSVATTTSTMPTTTVEPDEAPTTAQAAPSGPTTTRARPTTTTTTTTRTPPTTATTAAPTTTTTTTTTTVPTTATTAPTTTARATSSTATTTTSTTTPVFEPPPPIPTTTTSTTTRERDPCLVRFCERPGIDTRPPVIPTISIPQGPVIN
jgi:hypothetical protein